MVVAFAIMTSLNVLNESLTQDSDDVRQKPPKADPRAGKGGSDGVKVEEEAGNVFT